MKKILTLVAALAVAAGFLFTSCKKDTNTVKEFSYSIYLDLKTVTWTSEVGGDSSQGFNEWKDQILNPIREVFGAKNDTFTLKGTQAECDAQVTTACKILEPALALIKGGEATVSITNNTTGKTVWSFKVTK
ncbi:MAG: hypothetical protein IK074_02725 [Bacteroidales bacterium]|nr:hypothetical protein [Bacteroidales bacterium]